MILLKRKLHPESSGSRRSEVEMSRMEENDRLDAMRSLRFGVQVHRCFEPKMFAICKVKTSWSEKVLLAKGRSDFASMLEAGQWTTKIAEKNNVTSQCT